MAQHFFFLIQKQGAGTERVSKLSNFFISIVTPPGPADSFFFNRMNNPCKQVSHTVFSLVFLGIFLAYNDFS